MRGEGRKGSTDGPNHPALLLTVGIETKERRSGFKREGRKETREGRDKRRESRGFFSPRINDKESSSSSLREEGKKERAV